MALTAFKDSHTTGLSNMPVYRGVEAASQGFLAGALLIDSSGKCAVAAADPALGTILGVATKAATGVTDTEVLFTPALPHVVFEANLDDGTGTVVLAATHLWGRFGLAVTGGRFWLDSADTTATRAIVVGFRDALGTANARVYCTFLPGSSRFLVAAA